MRRRGVFATEGRGKDIGHGIRRYSWPKTHQMVVGGGVFVSLKGEISMITIGGFFEIYSRHLLFDYEERYDNMEQAMTRIIELLAA